MQIHLSGWSFKSEVQGTRIPCVWDSAVAGPEAPQPQSFGKWRNWALLCLSVPLQLPDGQVGVTDTCVLSPLTHTGAPTEIRLGILNNNLAIL